jgi:hypothetical protein
MLPYQMIAGGRFTLSIAGGVTAAVNVECQGQNPPDFIITRSVLNWAETTDAQSIEWWWEKSMSQGTARGLLQASAANGAATVTTATVATNGISTFDTANPPSFAALATTAITGNTGTFVVTMASTGSIQVGDYVRLYNTTGELQIAGYTFQVTAVTVDTSITLGYMASAVSAGGLATFAAAATAGSVLKYIPNRMYPRRKNIAMITKATQAVVYFTMKNDFTPGEIVSFRVSSDFGMVQINNKAVRVLSVTNSATVSSITIDLDTSAYTTFVFPLSAVAAAGVQSAQCVPASSGVVPNSGSATVAQQPPGTNLLDSFDDRNTRIIQFGPGCFDFPSFGGSDGDTWMWQAFRYDDYKIGTVTL